MFENNISKTLPKFLNLPFYESSPPINEVEFEFFYNEHSRSLWAYVHRVAGSPEIADEVMQETFLKFLGATLRTDENQKAYLYRIATNLTYDHFCRRKRETNRRTSFDSSGHDEPAYEQFPLESGLASVFDELNIQERSLLWLAYVEGYQHTEVAAMLGLNSLSVRVLLFRAKRKLAKLLDDENNEVHL